METRLDPATAENRQVPIEAAGKERRGVAELRDFMAKQTVTSRRQALLQSPDGDVLCIPTSVYKVLVAAVASMAQGNAVSIVPIHHELTTQRAAELLNVSRPHLVKLLETGEIPHHKTGSHRRIYFQDLMRYRDLRDAQRRNALDELTRKSAEYGLDY